MHRRSDLDDYPGAWDFPGGHVEPRESAASALVRELREELGVHAEVRGAPVLTISRHPSAEGGMVLQLWVIDSWAGEPRNAAPEEHDELRWITSDHVDDMAFTHRAYAPFLRALGDGGPPSMASAPRRTRSASLGW